MLHPGLTASSPTAAAARRRRRLASCAAEREETARSTPASRSQEPPPSPASAFSLARSDLVGKSIITRTTGASLGVATQLWLDGESWTVTALEVRPNVLAGEAQTLPLSALRRVGDVILVHDSRALRSAAAARGALPLVGADVVTESGEYLGKVRDFDFDPEDGELLRLRFDAFGFPQLPARPFPHPAPLTRSRAHSGAKTEQASVVSVYQLSADELLGCGAERVMARAGAERRAEQLSASLLQRLGLAEPPWEESLRFGAEPARSPPPQAARAPPARRRAWEARAPPAGIPLIRRAEAFERRDADGGFGARPGARPGARLGAGGAVPFREWAQAAPREPEEVAAEAEAAAAAPARRAGALSEDDFL